MEIGVTYDVYGIKVTLTEVDGVLVRTSVYPDGFTVSEKNYIEEPPYTVAGRSRCRMDMFDLATGESYPITPEKDSVI